MELLANIFLGWGLKKLLDNVWKILSRVIIRAFSGFPYVFVTRSKLADLRQKEQALKLLSDTLDEFKAADHVDQPLDQSEGFVWRN